MTKIIIAVIFIGLTFLSQSQPVQKSPNWTFSDIEGHPHTLYNYLDSGYTVIVNIASCAANLVSAQGWLYVNDGILNSIYQNYGPGYFGSHEIMVLVIEGDPNTSLADLQGTGPNTYGNWDLVVDCPIIQNDTIQNIYPLDETSGNPYPANYIICRDRSMLRTGWFSAEALLAVVNNCAVPQFNNDVTLVQTISPIGVNMFCDNPIVPEVKIYNSGNNPLTTLNIVSFVDDQPNSIYNWNGYLPVYNETVVSLPPIQGIEDGEHTLQLELQNPNSVADENPQDNFEESLFSTFAGGNEITLLIQTDLFPTETSWNLKTGNEILVSSTGYTNPKHLYTENLCLHLGQCYTLTVNDDFGDGMHGEINGYFSILFNGREIGRINGNEFDYTISKTFCVNYNKEHNFVSFEFENQSLPSQVDTINHTVNAFAHFNANLTSFISNFEISANAKAFVNGTEQISGSTENNFTNPVIYTIMAEDSSMQDWTVSVSFANKINIMKSENIVVYPNPGEGVIHFETNITGKFMLYSVNGKEIMSGVVSGQQLHLKDINPGLYLLIISNNHKTFKTKIQIKN